MNNRSFLAAALAMCCVVSGSLAGDKKITEQFSDVKINESYTSVRDKLLRHGWQIDAAWGISGVHEQLVYAQYPEVLCGDGYHAVCTGRFKKGDSAILLTIDQFMKRLPVKFISND